MGFKAMIRFSVHRELTGPVTDDGRVDVPAWQKDPSAVECRSADTVTVTEGAVSVRNGIVHLEYIEPDFVTVCLSFSKEEPELITLTRHEMLGDVNLMLVLEQGVRHTCLHHHDGEAFELIARAGYVYNDMMRSGVIDLDYSVEIHGARVEKTRMHVEVKKRTE